MGGRPPKEIWIAYTQFILECATNEEEKHKFLRGSEEYKREKLAGFGMKIPEGVRICIDSHAQGWPAVFIKVKDSEQKYILIEGSGAMHIIKDLPVYNPKDCSLLRSMGQKIKEMMKVSGEDLGGSYEVLVQHLDGIESVIDKGVEKQDIEVGVKIDEKLQDCEVGVRLPFWDADEDIFSELRFEDGEEIVLSCCS